MPQLYGITLQKLLDASVFVVIARSKILAPLSIPYRVGVASFNKQRLFVSKNCFNKRILTFVWLACHMVFKAFKSPTKIVFLLVISSLYACILIDVLGGL